MPFEGNESFDILERALKDYKKNFPGVEFFIDSLHSFVECEKAQYCSKVFNGVPLDVVQLKKNLSKVCAKTAVTCIDSKVPSPNERKYPDLTYVYDGHYTAWGNQWVGDKISKTIVSVFGD